MRKCILLFLICYCPLLLSGQYHFKGKITDAQSGEPIPFVNIGILNASLGTVSDEEGMYELRVPSSVAEPGDILRISSLGYQPEEYEFGELQLNHNLNIALKPTPIALKEVIVSSLPTYAVEEMAGEGIDRATQQAYWKDSLALGAELATVVRVDKGPRKLNTFFFNVLHNPADSIYFRINFYEIDRSTNLPGENLNKSSENILYTLKKGEAEAIVDLKPFDIWVRDDFIISLELLQVFGSDEILLVLPASEERFGRTLRRYASQGAWELIGSSGVGFYCQSTFYTDNERRANNKRVRRQLLKNQRKVRGLVLFGPRGLAGVLVENLNTNAETLSDSRGQYEILASPGDILRYTRIGSGDRPVLRRVRESGNITVNLRGR
ncbi:CarboxypepD_reg-like domain-containing protein [Robiginitalea myxolifaciens]|uniref:CarboxypepD_reg-like domain-containing protein n=1 Tax=Robiginitalea myxolifaciens TaxID=400055 RepID=A0A1I6GUA1_9FLAO|nr:carboxypeptidase-like regulatory domain-containing protein [Robiginitalea myxolifaciens]SFR45738.1 CarboxypepD_reg-like domain-containing protein [Robiginitalea myxolifaciens]